MKTLIALAALLLPLLILIANRDRAAPGVGQSPVDSQSAFASLSIEPVDPVPAPDFVLKDLHGGTVRLRDLRGKVVFLNFWATWCPSCRLEMASMELLHKDLGPHGLVVLALANRESADEVRAFYDEHHLTFPALLDENAEAAELYQTWSLPTTFMIDKRGRIVGKVIGYRDWHSEESKLLFEKLLRDSA